MQAANLRELAFAYASSDRRVALSVLWQLDAVFGAIIRSTTQPMIGQMRLTWWHDKLSKIEPNGAPDEPILLACSQHVLTRNVKPSELAALTAGWEPLLDAPPLTEAMIVSHGHDRGTRLFALAARILGSTVDDRLGFGWALHDLAAHWRNEAERREAWTASQTALNAVDYRGAPKPLKILARLAASQPFGRLGHPARRRDVLAALL